MCSEKKLTIVIIKCVPAIFSFFLVLHFFFLSWETCQLMGEIVVFLGIFEFDPFHVMCNMSISLLPLGFAAKRKNLFANFSKFLHFVRSRKNVKIDQKRPMVFVKKFFRKTKFSRNFYSSFCIFRFIKLHEKMLNFEKNFRIFSRNVSFAATYCT